MTPLMIRLSRHPLGCTLVVSLLVVATLVMTQPGHAEPEGPGPTHIMVCVNTTPGTLVANGTDDNLLLVSQSASTTASSPTHEAVIGFIGCVTTFGCLPNKDIDGDGDIDLDDYGIFAGCLNGPGIAYPGGCREADFNCDGDVDMRDFAALQVPFEP